MNIVLWVLQVLLALHTLIGAGWKLSNSEQTVPSLGAIPHRVWQGMSVVEVLCSIALVLPFFVASMGLAAPIAAAFIAAEMLLFTGLHLASGDKERGQVIYWLVVAALCGFIAFGRFVWMPF